MADKSIIIEIETPDGYEWEQFELGSWLAIERWVKIQTGGYDGDFQPDIDLDGEGGTVFYRCEDSGLEKRDQILFTYQIEEVEDDCGCSSYFCPCSGTKSYSSAWL